MSFNFLKELIKLLGEINLMEESSLLLTLVGIPGDAKLPLHIWFVHLRKLSTAEVKQERRILEHRFEK